MKTREWIFLVLLTGLAALVTFGAMWDVYQVAWGTGKWLGEFSLKWAFLFFIFLLSGLALFILTVAVLWRPDRFTAIASQLARFRNRLGWLRWLLIACLSLAPVWWFQFTYWGVVFTGIGFRLLVWALILLTCACFIPASGKELLTWPSTLAAAVLSSAVFLAAIPLGTVTSYPFSLGWSEGNRLWDYSMLFGKDLYVFSQEQGVSAFIDIGRQFIGGLPFLFPHVTIFEERLWVALTTILPYLLLGWSAFDLPKTKAAPWLLASLWTLAFLRQGPIHPPLLISATLVALTWRKRLWISIAGIALASWFASISRFTWMFAPSLWAGMLVLAGAGGGSRSGPSRRDWWKVIILAASGLLSGVIIPFAPRLMADSAAASKPLGAVTSQPLLWYRLLPNGTYPGGILLNLLIAILPLVVFLAYLVARKTWPLYPWPRTALLLPLLAFLIVGLIVSTKIGGGADLHNMDMFLIGLVFAASIAWEKVGQSWIVEGDSSSLMRVVLFLLVALPAFGSLVSMRPRLNAEDFSRLKVLAGIADDPRNNPQLLGFLPPEQAVEQALATIDSQVAAARRDGEVLFMDQRQLLTFGFIQNVPLVPGYEKKYLMDRAMGNDRPALAPFYKDLAAHRFSMIVTEPLRMFIKDSDYSFGEENNAWVKWVANPVLCYYEPKVTLDQFGIQLLTPRRQPLDCSLP